MRLSGCRRYTTSTRPDSTPRSYAAEFSASAAPASRTCKRSNGLHDALLPSGTLVLDNEEKPFTWQVHDWGTRSEGEISLRLRVDAVDDGDRCVHMTMRAETRDGRREEHVLTIRQWYRDELVPQIHDAGFASVDVLPGVDENTLVYVAARE